MADLPTGTVTFKDGTVTEGFLSFKAFLQLVKMKCAKTVKPDPKPSGNGVPLAVAAK